MGTPKKEGNELKEVTNSISGSSQYAFEGRVIRLTHEDFNRWREAYPFLDIRAELQSRDDWLRETPHRQKGWFMSTSTHLSNRNQKAKDQAGTPKRAAGEGLI